MSRGDGADRRHQFGAFRVLEYVAVGAGIERAVVRDGKIAVATQMKVTLSSDHRAVDGALGAELMGAFKIYIESPIAMLV